MIGYDGQVRLLDFGIAKALGAATDHRSRTGSIKGKLSYMAPEYTLGRLDHRADLFALGVVTHEMLTGRALFDAPRDHDIINLLREMPIQPPSRWNPRVTPDVDNIVMTALQRDPEQRWQSAAAMGAALQEAVRTEKYVTNPAALAAWVEWAFMQEMRGDVSGLTEVIADLGDASDPRRKRTTTPVTVKSSLARPPSPTPVTLSRTPRHATDAKTNPVPVVRKLGVARAALLALVLAAGAASAAYFALGLL